MRCARCNSALDDGTMVCSQCGAVVGMAYGKEPPKSGFNVPKVPQPSFPAPRTGATRGLPGRVKAIIGSPRSEWKVIAAEPTGLVDIYTGYVIPLALIGPVAFAIYQVAFGTPLPLVGVVKAAVVAGIGAAMLAFAFALLQVFVLTLAVNALAPKFGAVPDRLGALKVVAYSLTPIWVVGILYLVPVLGFLWVFAAIYAMILAFIGLQVVMRCSPQQAVGYALTTLGIAFALWVGTGALVTAIMGFGPVMLE